MKTNQTVVVTLDERNVIGKVYTMDAWTALNDKWRAAETKRCDDAIKVLDGIINDVKDLSVTDISFTGNSLFGYTASISMPKYKEHSDILNQYGLHYGGACLKIRMREMNFSKVAVAANTALFNARHEIELYKRSLYRTTIAKIFALRTLVDEKD